MGLLDYFTRKNRKELVTPVSQDAEPRTYEVSTTGKPLSKFQKRERDLDILVKYRIAYEQGGMVTKAFDTFPQYVLTNGYHLEGEDENLTKTVKTWLDSFDFEACVTRLIIDSMVEKYAFQEKVKTRTGGIHSLKPAPSFSFEIKKDQHGKTIEIRQYKDNNAWGGAFLQFTPDDIVVFEYTWLMHSAYDDIMRDVKVLDGIVSSIERHGFPRYHIQVGQPGINVGKDVTSGIGKQFESLKPNMEMVTVRDVDIHNIDTGGVAQAGNYNNVTVQRVTSALGVPEEILGLGRGSTEATANVRLQAFYDSIGALQRAVARCYNIQVIDKLTGKPGAVKLVFNDVSPIDDKMKMEVAQMMATTNGQIDPEYYFTRKEIRLKAGFEDDHPDELMEVQKVVPFLE